MKKDHALKKAALEKEALDHYTKVFDHMFRWCIYNQPQDIETVLTVFGVDKKELTIKACEEVLEKWKNPESTSANQSKSKPSSGQEAT